MQAIKKATISSLRDSILFILYLNLSTDELEKPFKFILIKKLVN
jgi:hypothetical protein